MLNRFKPTAETAKTLRDIQTEIRAARILRTEDDAERGYNIGSDRALQIIQNYQNGLGLFQIEANIAMDLAHAAALQDAADAVDASHAAARQSAADAVDFSHAAARQSATNAVDALHAAAEIRCSECNRRDGSQHRPSCHRQGIVTSASDYRDETNRGPHA